MIDEEVVHYAALISDLVFKTKSYMNKMKQVPDDFQCIQIRTAKYTEMIITSSNDFIMLVIQQSLGAPAEEVAAAT
jgi:hypothetical protein